jgi:chromosome segregation ATPase
MAIQSRTIEEIEGAVGFGGRMALLISLLQDPKNLQKVSAELEKAKAVIAESDEVLKMKKEAEATIATAKDIDIKRQTLNDDIAASAKVEAANKLRTSELAETAKNLAKLQKQAEKDAAAAEATLASAQEKETAAQALIDSNKELETQLKARIEGVNQRLESLKVA